MIFGYAAKIPFSPADAQEFGLHGMGIKNVYVEGRGAETLESCLYAYRNEPGELHIFGSLRVFAGTRPSPTVPLLNRHVQPTVSTVHDALSAALVHGTAP